IDFRLRTRYLDQKAATLDDALNVLAQARSAGRAVSIGLLGNTADVFPEIVRRGIVPDVVTDQTSAHDPLNGYLPQGWTLAEWKGKGKGDPPGGYGGGEGGVGGGVRGGRGQAKEGGGAGGHAQKTQQEGAGGGGANSTLKPPRW